jgi:hypothetical protein
LGRKLTPFENVLFVIIKTTTNNNIRQLFCSVIISMALAVLSCNCNAQQEVREKVMEGKVTLWVLNYTMWEVGTHGTSLSRWFLWAVFRIYVLEGIWAVLRKPDIMQHQFFET